MRPMQLTKEKPATDTIRAGFNYIVDTGVPPVRYIDWPEMEHKAVPPQYRQYEMTVRNGRPLRETFRLDVHGFVFTDHATRVKDFTDEDERVRVYDPEMQELIRRISGASAVVVFDHTIRVSDELNIDLASDGTIYGIELLNANEQLRAGDGGRIVVVDEANGEERALALASEPPMTGARGGLVCR